MTRGLLAVPYSEAAISREAQAGSPERKKNHPTGFRPQPSSSSAPGHGCEDYNAMVVMITMVVVAMITMMVRVMVLTMLKTWNLVTLESHTKR